MWRENGCGGRGGGREGGVERVVEEGGLEGGEEERSGRERVYGKGGEKGKSKRGLGCSTHRNKLG